jgi:hypothetical protein
MYREKRKVVVVAMYSDTLLSVGASVLTTVKKNGINGVANFIWKGKCS